MGYEQVRGDGDRSGEMDMGQGAPSQFFISWWVSSSYVGSGVVMQEVN